jgi:hypothetical protein
MYAIVWMIFPHYLSLFLSLLARAAAVARNGVGVGGESLRPGVQVRT